jgi:hypothetical protein
LGGWKSEMLGRKVDVTALWGSERRGRWALGSGEGLGRINHHVSDV